MDIAELPQELFTIAGRLAYEGVPVAAIARAFAVPFSSMHGALETHLSIGTIVSMPASDWPPTARRADRMPTYVRGDSDELQLASLQHAMGLTKLEAGFMLVLMKRSEADKKTLHYVIETQRAFRKSRLNSQESTDPKMVDVVICKLRKKVLPYGITIQTLWGHGYFIDAAGRKIVEDLIARTSAGFESNVAAAG